MALRKTMFTRQEDIIYGRKYGTALTLDVLTPQDSANGIGLIFVVSGARVASHAAIDVLEPIFMGPLVSRGYTVFAMIPSSQPKYAIPEIVQDVQQCIRFIRYHAQDYGICPDRLGIFGSSAGGHLSLLSGLTAGPGDPQAPNPVDTQSSEVQAIGAFCAPTDFLNYGGPGVNGLGQAALTECKAAFAFNEFDSATKTFSLIMEPQRIRETVRRISPVTHVGPGAPPTILIHGDADLIVPLQQSEILHQAMEAACVESKLVVVPGAAHGWPDMTTEVGLLGDWFDAHLLPSIEKPG